MNFLINLLMRLSAPIRKPLGITDHLFHQLAGFLFVGLCSSAAFAGVHLGLIYWLDVNEVIATIPAFITGLIISYTGNSRFSFSAPMTRPVLMRFTVVTLTGLAIGMGLVTFAEIMGWPPYVGTISNVTMVPPCNFIGHKFWTYRKIADSAHYEA